MHRAELSGPEHSTVTGPSHGPFSQVPSQAEPGNEAAQPGDRERAICWETPSLE